MQEDRESVKEEGMKKGSFRLQKRMGKSIKVTRGCRQWW